MFIRDTILGLVKITKLKLIRDMQHTFLKKRSCLSNLVELSICERFRERGEIIKYVKLVSSHEISLDGGTIYDRLFDTTS